MTADQRADIPPAVLDRMAGMEYAEIATKYGKHVQTIRYLCKKAIVCGLVTAEQVYYTAQIKKPAIPSGQYEAHWIKSVMDKCVIDANGCWLWQGFRGTKGYGYRGFRNRNVAVHRKMFELTRGVQLATEQLVCHRCDVRNCCNPAHLWEGSAASNNFDSASKARHRNNVKTHCPRGHSYDEENTYFAPNGARNCKICMRARMRRAAGWPSDLAYSMPAVPHGQRPVNAKNYRRRTAA